MLKHEKSSTYLKYTVSAFFLKEVCFYYRPSQLSYLDVMLYYWLYQLEFLCCWYSLKGQYSIKFFFFSDYMHELCSSCVFDVSGERNQDTKGSNLVSWHLTSKHRYLAILLVYMGIWMFHTRRDWVWLLWWQPIRIRICQILPFWDNPVCCNTIGKSLWIMFTVIQDPSDLEHVRCLDAVGPKVE